MKINYCLHLAIISMCMIAAGLKAVNPLYKSTIFPQKNSLNTTHNPPCPTDINRDGVTDNKDLSLLLQKFGQSSHCPEDISGDGLVSAKDLSLLLQNFNKQCKCWVNASEEGTNL